MEGMKNEIGYFRVMNERCLLIKTLITMKLLLPILKWLLI